MAVCEERWPVSGDAALSRLTKSSVVPDDRVEAGRDKTQRDDVYLLDTSEVDRKDREA
jgi:hypothetical protein